MISVILNNRVLGMVHQWQDDFYGGRHSASEPDWKTDYVKVAEGFGAKGYRCADLSELQTLVSRALREMGPVWIECPIAQTERVLPMIPAGGTVRDSITR